MGQKIGKPTFVKKIILNVPQLLAEISTSEEHTKHIQAIQILSLILDEIATRSIQLNDPILIDLLYKMKMIQINISKEESGFEDI